MPALPSLSSLAACPSTFLALAPMDGITDALTRDLLTRENLRSDGTNAVSLCVSEFVRVTQDAVTEKVFLREVPELRADGCTATGVPVFVQLLGGDPALMAESARRAAALGARGVDINFGCPAKTVNRHDGGATLLKYPDRMIAITAAMREALPDHVPLSVKIRTGWDSTAAVEELAQAAERGGAAFLTVHGRTRMDMYKPAADMTAIARARAAVSIPVVANGDLHSPAALAACAAVTGCEAFMIGRGAMAAPNLFLQMREHAATQTRSHYASFLCSYADRMISAHISDVRALGRLKNWLCLAAKVSPALGSLFEIVKRAPTLSVVIDVLRREVIFPETSCANLTGHEQKQVVHV